MNRIQKYWKRQNRKYKVKLHNKSLQFKQDLEFINMINIIRKEVNNMEVLFEGKLLELKKDKFTTKEGESKDYDKFVLEGDDKQPFRLSIDPDLAKGLYPNIDKIVGKEVNGVMKLSRWQGQLRAKITSLQLTA